MTRAQWKGLAMIAVPVILFLAVCLYFAGFASVWWVVARILLVAAGVVGVGLVIAWFERAFGLLSGEED